MKTGNLQIKSFKAKIESWKVAKNKNRACFESTEKDRHEQVVYWTAEGGKTDVEEEKKLSLE